MRYASVVTLELANNRPRSRGRIRLRSSGINEPPVFDGPYLKDVNDSVSYPYPYP